MRNAAFHRSDAVLSIRASRSISDRSVTCTATFALPTDATDLNHVGFLIRFAGGITFYNSGDTAYSERLLPLLPSGVDICAICINGGFHNLSAQDAAFVVRTVNPRVVIPCHYDMMVNNIGSPEMFKVALDNLGVESQVHRTEVLRTLGVSGAVGRTAPRRGLSKNGEEQYGNLS